jgi:hypothetical protein
MTQAFIELRSVAITREEFKEHRGRNGAANKRK